MKGKAEFTAEQANEIRRLLARKIALPSGSKEARRIRKELREHFRFYSEDFVGKRQFGPADFDRFVESGRITIIDSAQHSVGPENSRSTVTPRMRRNRSTRRRDDSDEAYVIDLCDEILKQRAQRQHTFSFLRGDPNARGLCRALPVDAFYHSLNLVVEFRETQHSDPVEHFDKPHTTTVSGVHRGIQRQIYDQRRREALQAQSISLVEVEYTELAHDSKKKLKRDQVHDRAVLQRRLADHLL
jgi:hypothetical protein